MTVTVVYGNAIDGYMWSYDPNYATARNGPADGVDNSSSGWYGQNNNDGQYGTFQTLISFTYATIPATSLIAAAMIETEQAVQYSTAIGRDMEYRSVGRVSGGALTTADWQDNSDISVSGFWGAVQNVQNSVNQRTRAGSDTFLAGLPSWPTADILLISNRQRQGFVPTADEGSAVWTADNSGTTYDPALVFTTMTRTHFTPVLGGVAQLSDGSMVHLVTNGAATPTVELWRVPLVGLAQFIGAVPVGGGVTGFENAAVGNQAMTVCVDAQDNIYVVGKWDAAQNRLAARAWKKTTGSWAWTAGAISDVPLPTYDASVNNVAAAWHPTANGTLVVLAAHTAGSGIGGGTGNELAWALLGTDYLLNGTGSLVRATGSALGTLQPAGQTDFNSYANEAGTGLDVVADAVQPDWGYVLSFRKSQLLDANEALAVGRYILNSAGNGFTVTGTTATSWGVKDAAARVRVLAVGDGQVATVTADRDAGWGISVRVFKANGSQASMTLLGSFTLADEGMASMPDGPAITTTTLWDAIYSPADRAVWIYYRHATQTTKLYRTSVSLVSYQATRVEKLVVDTGAGNVITSVRVARNGKATDRAVVGYTTLNGATLGHAELVDQFNLAPTAPTLTPRANFDSSQAADFTWTFTDPNPGDTQSAYALEIQRVDTGAAVVTTGKTPGAVTTRTVAANTLTNGLDYRWRVQTWDSQDAVSPFSDWGTFSTSAGGTVTVTDPATDNPPNLITDEVQVTWAVTGTVQAAYRVTLKRDDTGVIISDTGWVTGTATQLLISGMVTGVTHTVSVQARNSANVTSGIGTRKLTPNYGTPEVPLVTVTPVPAEGYVLVNVDNPISGQPVLGTTPDTFEASIGTWTASGGAVAWSTDFAHSGTHSLKLTVAGTPTQAYARSGPATRVPVQATERYTARMWVYSAAARNVSATIDWYTAGGASLTSISFVAAVPAARWTEIQVTGTCPDGAALAEYGPTLTGSPATGTVIYLDDPILVAASDRPEVTVNRVLRRRAGSQDRWLVLGTCDPDGSFRDYTAPSRVPVEYMVRGEA